MPAVDFNLLSVLDAVLVEGNVTRAAERLGLSPSAMSRALGRLRTATGDPLLVRSGRGLVPTPRALELREQVPELRAAVEAALRPAPPLNLWQLQRTFTVQARTGFVENYGLPLLTRVRDRAPGVTLHYVLNPERAATELRQGTLDLSIGVLRERDPELQTQLLFTDRFIGVVRTGHPLTGADVTAERYGACEHVGVSRQGRERGPVDDALAAHGHHRAVRVMVSEFSTALTLTRTSDLVATVPERQTAQLRADLHSFPLPFPVPKMPLALQWHARMDADPAHRWLRRLIADVCTGTPDLVKAAYHGVD